MPIILLLLFLLSPVTEAKEKKAEKIKGATIVYAGEPEERDTENMHPCQRMDYYSKEDSESTAPDLSCKKAWELSDQIIEADSRLLHNCNELSVWLQLRLEDPNLCGPDREKNLADMKKKFSALEKSSKFPSPFDTPELAEKDAFERGEFKNPACSCPAIMMHVHAILMETLRKQHYKKAESAVNAACGPGSKAKEAYLLYLKTES